MTSSQSGQTSSGAFAFPPLPVIAHRPETVVNPEGRGAEDPLHSSPGQPSSSVWQRLFPQALGSSDEDLGRAFPSPEGFRLGHFVLQERIGIGGMGAVFRAMDTRLQRIVALKVLGPAQSRDESSVKRFQNEASAAARLDHDNIARVYYIGEDQGLHFIAFEYITGTNLRDLIHQTGLISPRDAVNYTIQIATALNHTHAAGVVHRDIKPSNIIIMPNGRAKLVDLGLARKQNSDSVAELTLAGTTLGTFDYISPEQAKDPRTADVRSDIYSLGCTLYHALTGQPPYPEGTVLQKLLDHQGKEAPDPALKNRNIPPDLSAICRKMMASDPKYRYATPEILVRDLMAVAARMGLRGLPADGLIWRHVTPPKETFWERNLGWMASVTVLLLIVFVIWRFPGLGIAPGGNNNSRLAARGNPAEATGSGPATAQTNGESSESSPISVPSELTDTGDAGTRLEFPEIVRSIPPFNGESGLNSKPGALRPFDQIPLLTDPQNDDPDEVGSPDPQSPIPVEIAGDAGTKPVKPAESPEAPATPVIPITEAEMRPYWIIDNAGSEDVGKLTLEAACTAARDGQIIEIRHNGPLPDFLTKPIRIKNKSLTIRAGENYRPLLQFAGIDSQAEGLLTRLFRLSNASVDLINLDFHISPQNGMATGETWSLVSLEGSGRVLLQGVTVSMDEAPQELAAVVELLPAPASQTAKDMKMMTQDIDSPSAWFEVKILKSFIRGNSNVLLSRHTLPGRIEIDQSAIAVDKSLLLAEGDLDMKSDKDQVELTLDHTTCFVGESLIRMDSGDTPRDLLPVAVRNTRDNIIATNTSNPLIVMTGSNDPDVYEQLLRWEGFKNFYAGFQVFWAIPSSDFMPRNFEAWVAGWNQNSNSNEKEEGAQNGNLAWKSGGPLTEFTDITALDLELDSSVPNLAVGGATDGINVGADLTQLPKLPPRAFTGP